MQLPLLLQTAEPSSPLGEMFRNPWAIAVLVLAVAVVALFIRLQSLSSRIEEVLERLTPMPSAPNAPGAPRAATPDAMPVPVAPAGTVPPTSGGLPDGHLIAIVTAAAVAAIGKPVVVRRLTFLNQNTVSGWAEAGRLMIQTSHNMRRKV